MVEMFTDQTDRNPPVLGAPYHGVLTSTDQLNIRNTVMIKQTKSGSVEPIGCTRGRQGGLPHLPAETPMR